jgi:hypothetical protein
METLFSSPGSANGAFIKRKENYISRLHLIIGYVTVSLLLSHAVFVKFGGIYHLIKT